MMSPPNCDICTKLEKLTLNLAAKVFLKDKTKNIFTREVRELAFTFYRMPLRGCSRLRRSMRRSL